MSGRLTLDVRSAVRSIRRTPVLSVAVMLSLALGIGANVAIFSLCNQALLKRLPVPRADQLVTLSAAGDKPGWVSSKSGSGGAVFSYPLFRDLERDQDVFTGLAAHRDVETNIAYRGRTSNESALLVSGSYFPVLGVQPALGRLLSPSDDTTPGAHRLVVLSYDYWSSRFGQDPAILNDTLIVNGEPMTVIGVAAQGFRGTWPGDPPRMFLPLTMSAAIHSEYDDLGSRRTHWLYLFARLKPGTSRSAAQSSANALFSGIMQTVEVPQLKRESDRMRREYGSRQLVLSDGERGEQPNRSEQTLEFVLLFSITGTVILIACANIANLLLARGVSRAGEFAVRLSLGASRSQLIAQLMIESCILAVAGGAAGILVAKWILDFLRATRPIARDTYLPFIIDLPLLVFAFGLSLLTAVVFGMLPAIHSTRIRVTTMARSQGGVTAAGTSGPLRSALVTAQIALALTLLVVAGLFARSLVNIGRVDLGMRVSNVVTFRISPALNGYTSERSRALFEQVAEELRAIPGVSSVAESTIPMLAGSNSSMNVTVQGFEAGPDDDTDASNSMVGPGFFSTLGIPLIAGREFMTSDTALSQPVAIVNEAFAAKFNLGRNAIGTRMELGRSDKPKLDIEIVGLARDAKYSEVKSDTPPAFFLAYRQRDTRGSISYYVRSSLDPAQVSAAATRIMAKVDPNLPIEGFRTMESQVRDHAASDLLLGQVATGFGALATLLAAIGLYGVLAYSVAQRTPEIGVRLALGADAGRIWRMILFYVGRLAIAGVLIGLAGASALGRLAESQLFNVNGADAAVMTAAVSVVILVSIGAAVVPAYRASRVDPSRALRWE